MENNCKYCSMCQWYAENGEGVCLNENGEFWNKFRFLDDTCKSWECIDRYISAEKLKQAISKKYTKAEAKALYRLIDAQQTAYNLDKVIEQLQNASWWTDSSYDDDGYSNDDESEVINLEKAVEIVERGRK